MTPACRATTSSTLRTFICWISSRFRFTSDAAFSRSTCAFWPVTVTVCRASALEDKRASWVVVWPTFTVTALCTAVP